MMTFYVQEGLKLSKPGGICAVGTVLRKDHPSNPQFLPIFHCIAVLKRIVVSWHLVSVRP